MSRIFENLNIFPGFLSVKMGSVQPKTCVFLWHVGLKDQGLQFMTKEKTCSFYLRYLAWLFAKLVSYLRKETLLCSALIQSWILHQGPCCALCFLHLLLVLDRTLGGNGLHVPLLCTLIFWVPPLILIPWSTYSASVLNKLMHRLPET